MLEGKR